MFTIAATIALVSTAATFAAGAFAAFTGGRAVRAPGPTFEDLCGSSTSNAFLAGLGF